MENERKPIRKLTMVIPLAAAAAFAADEIIHCRSIPCYGTGNDDKIYERHHNGADDRIIMKGGHDIVLASERFIRANTALADEVE